MGKPRSVKISKRQTFSKVFKLEALRQLEKCAQKWDRLQLYFTPHSAAIAHCLSSRNPCHATPE
jgi:hypothetical protein